MTVVVGGHPVRGGVIDAQTRCVHWAGALDVLAILFPCCGRWYPCHSCHEEDADHPAVPWPADARGNRALLCGLCGKTETIAEYLDVGACVHCGAAFNPGCRLHHPLYFV